MEFVNKATGCKFQRGKWKWMFAVFGRLQKFWMIFMRFFLGRFRDSIRVPRVSNRVPRIRENYHRVPKIREYLVPRITEIGSLQIHTAYLTFSFKENWFLLSWYLAMCQIFCCCTVQGVSFNYHYRNVRSRVSVSNFQVSVSAFMSKTRSRLDIWARSRSRRLRSRLHHCQVMPQLRRLLPESTPAIRLRDHLCSTQCWVRITRSKVNVVKVLVSVSGV